MSLYIYLKRSSLHCKTNNINPTNCIHKSHTNLGNKSLGENKVTTATLKMLLLFMNGFSKFEWLYTLDRNVLPFCRLQNFEFLIVLVITKFTLFAFDGFVFIINTMQKLYIQLSKFKNFFWQMVHVKHFYKCHTRIDFFLYEHMESSIYDSETESAITNFIIYILFKWLVFNIET